MELMSLLSTLITTGESIINKCLTLKTAKKDQETIEDIYNNLIQLGEGLISCATAVQSQHEMLLKHQELLMALVKTSLPEIPASEFK